VKFILATTDPLKLPATILSRTQHFRFKKIPQNLVLKHLEHILTLENVGFESDALDIIARSGAGSLRDSLTLADQAIVYSKNFVDMATVTGMLGIIEPTHLATLVQDIMNKDTNKILDFIKMSSDYECEMILDEFTLYLKDLLLSRDNALTPMIIERFFRVLAESKGLLALGSNGEFVLSLALFKMMESLEIKDIDSMIRSLENELKGIEVTPSPAVIIKAPQEHKLIVQESIQEKEEIQAVEEPKIENPKEVVTETVVEVVSEEIKPYPHQKTFETLLEKIYDRNYELGQSFENTIRFKSFENNTLTWESSAKDKDKKALITHWGLINMFVKDCFGFETKIVNISQTKAPQTETIKEVAVTQAIPSPQTPPPPSIDEAQMKSSCIAPEAGETESAKEKDPSTLLQEPMIKEAIALLDPKKVRIKRNS
jgi:DNA polymerase-3 subunit gamma/tau